MTALGQHPSHPQERPTQDHNSAESSQSQPADKHTVKAPSALAPIAPAEPSGVDHNDRSQPEKNAEPNEPFKSGEIFNVWGDTPAQWVMAVAGMAAIFISIWAVFLLWKTLKATRDVLSEAEKTTKAAQDAVAEARKQADAMIRIEAAKFILKEVVMYPEGGGERQTRGVPEDGNVITARLQNIGNTPAFPLRSCLLWKIREVPPKIRLPLSAVHHYPPGKIVEPGTDIKLKNAFGPISLNKESAAAIQSGDAVLWAYGSISFKDWFGIERTEKFILRWKGFQEPNENPNIIRFGFVPHGKAE